MRCVFLFFKFKINFQHRRHYITSKRRCDGFQGARQALFRNLQAHVIPQIRHVRNYKCGRFKYPIPCQP